MISAQKYRTVVQAYYGDEQVPDKEVGIVLNSDATNNLHCVILQFELFLQFFVTLLPRLMSTDQLLMFTIHQSSFSR